MNASAQTPRFRQDRFAIGFWVDPPAGADMDARYQEIAAANFTVVLGGFGASTPETVRRQAELCAKYDLRAVVSMAGLPVAQLPEDPAIWGYMLRDEPNAADFPALRKTVDEIRGARPGRLSYINLYPNYANEQQLGTRTYDEHVRQIYTSLAYGAKGVLYFCYWTPRGAEFPRGGAVITAEGRRTRHYDQARRINQAVKNLGPTLMCLKSTAVHRIGPDDDPAAALAGSPVKDLSKGDYLVGLFTHADGRRAVLLNNYSFAYTAWPTVEFDADPAQVREISQATGEEVPLLDDSPAMEGVQVSLDAGEGRLFLLPR